MYNNENQVIGLLIGYYRKKLNENDPGFSRYNFIKEKSELVRELCKDCNKVCAKRSAICSIKTSICLEKGDPIKNTCYYIDLTFKLNKKYILNRKILDLITYAEKKMISLIKSYYRDDLIKFRDFLIVSMKSYSNVIYITELLQLYLAITDYMLYFKFPQQELVNMYELLYPKLSSQTQALIAYLLIKYYEYSINDKDKVNLYLDELTLMKINPFEIKLKKLHKNLSVIELYDILIKMPLSKYSRYEQVLIRLYLADIYFLIEEYEKSLVILERIVEDLKNTNIPLVNMILGRTLSKKGTVLFSLQEYDQAINVYKEVFEMGPDLLSQDFMVFIHCLMKSNQKYYVNHYINLNIYQEITSVIVKKIFQYYILKLNSKTLPKSLISFALKNLKPVLPEKTVAYQVMKNDLIEYSSKKNIK